MTVDPDALAQVLKAVDLRIGTGRRESLDAGALMPLPRGAVTLVYVTSGTVHGQARGGVGCRVDAGREVQLCASEAAARLEAGDAFLTFGGGDIVLDVAERTELMILDLVLSDATARLVAAMPPFITVCDFATIDPAAAGLAGNMGHDPSASCAQREGDLLICRMMATTVVLAVLRAWSLGGHAPADWPPSRDPHLDRVVAAIHDDPGSEWTVERMAGIGAMSRSAFAERFRNALGRSPADYVTEVRIEQAKRMLESGLPVSAISRDLGYASDEGFSRAFRRRTGMTPSSWRMAERMPVPA